MQKLTDLKTFEDACTIEGIKPDSITASGLSQEDNNALLALAKLFIIVRAANRLINDGKEWKPDYNDNTWKYFAWFAMDGGSGGFRYDDCAHWTSGSSVGSRLCFKTSEAAEYIGTQFTDLYKAFMVIE